MSLNYFDSLVIELVTFVFAANFLGEQGNLFSFWQYGCSVSVGKSFCQISTFGSLISSI